MKPSYLISVILMTAVGTVACGDDDEATPTATDPTPQTTAAATTVAPTPSAPSADPAGDVLFADTFEDDRNGWGLVDGEFGTTSYADGDYVWVFTGSGAHWLPSVLGDQYDAGELEMLDVVVRADVTIDNGGGVAGVFCRETPDTDAEWQWYEFVARDGYAAIRRTDSESNLDVLAETDDVSLPMGEPFTVEASCVDGDDGTAQLTMSVNDEPLLEASDDDPLDNGVSGIQAYTYPVHDQIDIRWHEFSVTQSS